MNVISAFRMKRWTARLAAPLLTAALAGCSVMNKDDCAKADWRQLGLSDASQGRGSDRLQDRRQACAKHGVAVDEGAYGLGYADGRKIYCTASRGQAAGKAGDAVPEVCEGLHDAEYGSGYQAGLRSFCTPIGGYERARNGMPYLGQCPPGSEDKVMIGMRLGKEIYDLNARLAAIEDEKQKAENTLKNDKATDTERREARRRLSDLRGEEISVRAMIGDGELRATRLR